MTAFRNPAVTVDGVVVAGGPRPDDRVVLLVERGIEPFKGCCALPGGFVEYGEDIDDAVHREIAEETGLTGLVFRQFAAFGGPDRDPRGHTVSVVYIAEIGGPAPKVQGGDDAASAAWHPATDLPDLAFDHGEILEKALASLPAP